MRADGNSIPSPRSFEELQRDPDFADSAGAIVTMVTPHQAMAAE